MATKHLRTAGAKRLTVMNRTSSKGEEFGEKLGVTGVSCDDWLTHPTRAVFHVMPAQRDQPGRREIDCEARRYKPLVVIDIACHGMSRWSSAIARKTKIRRNRPIRL